jgi:hypothetical protein
MRVTILITFPCPADSPTGRSPLRLRYALRRDGGRVRPVLTYAHGVCELTQETWSAWRMSGAVIAADTDREAAIVREVLGA